MGGFLQKRTASEHAKPSITTYLTLRILPVEVEYFLKLILYLSNDFRLINGEVVPVTEGIYGRDSDEEVHEDIAYGSFVDPNRSKTMSLKVIQ